MSVNVDNVETCTKTAIGNLLFRADELTKRVLTAFDPSANSRSAMLKSLSFNLDILEACAEFLGIKLADGDDNKIYTKESLKSRIILEISALLPATCSECLAQYMVEFEADEKPIYHCFMCFQGSHNCSAMKSKAEALSQVSGPLPAGSIWLCHQCLDKSNPVIPRKTKSRHDSVSRSRANSVTQPNTESRPSSVSPDNESRNQPPPGNVCERYKSGKCPHGIRGNKLVGGQKCSMGHPKRCIKYCRNGSQGKYGCKRGEQCKYFHPKLCKHSLQKRPCLNAQCTFVHLPGTKRESEVPRESGNERNDRNRNDRDRNRVRSAPPRREYIQADPNTPTPTNSINSKHFLELRTLVETMNNNFHQEIASLRASMYQAQKSQFCNMPPPPVINQSPLINFPSAPSMSNPLQLQQQAYCQAFPPSMTYIPPSSC